MNPTDLNLAQLAAQDAARVALIWEITQALIALALTGATIWATLHQVASAELSNAFFIIVGFYFGRLISKNVSTQTQGI